MQYYAYGEAFAYAFAYAYLFAYARAYACVYAYAYYAFAHAHAYASRLHSDCTPTALRLLMRLFMLPKVLSPSCAGVLKVL